MQESLPILHVNEGFNAIAMFNKFNNPMVCTVIDEGSNRPVSFDGSGDTNIPDISNGDHEVASGPAVVEDISDEASECSLEVKPLSLDKFGHESDLLPNVEKDVDEVNTVHDYDGAMLSDVNNIDLDDEEIPQLHESGLDRLKDTMNAPLSPSQNEFLQ